MSFCLPDYLPRKAAISIYIGAVVALMAASPAHALYKYLDESGRVTYSDRPPPPGAKSLDSNTSGAGVAASDLPFALKASVTRYPVTLYSIPDCAPCNDARKLFETRGIPFAEKSVRTPSDNAALKKANLPTDSFPLITVGGQKQTAFEATALHGLLDAAGYPKSSALPSSYRHAAAQPAGIGMTNATGATSAANDAKSKATNSVTDDGKTVAAKTEDGQKKPVERKVTERRAIAPQAAQNTLRF